MADTLHRMLDEGHRQALEADTGGITAIVASTATAPTDEVEVTLPYSERPTLRHDVSWSLGVKLVAGVLQPRYPTRGDQGIVIEATDTGELWLIW